METIAGGGGILTIYTKFKTSWNMNSHDWNMNI